MRTHTIKLVRVQSTGKMRQRMDDIILDIQDLHVLVDGTPLLQGVNLTMKKGEIHVLMGPNGAGKSTLGFAVMGHPSYEVTRGSIIFENENITGYSTDVGARKGLFLSFQAPEELPGVTEENFLRTAKAAVTGETLRPWKFHKTLLSQMAELNMDEQYASRYVNVGFSGGEKKKNEIFQMLMMKPKLAILDEADSGLDVDAVKTVSDGIQNFKTEENSLLIITHNTRLLETLQIDAVHILVDGKIAERGDASLVDEINRNGFAKYNNE